MRFTLLNIKEFGGVGGSMRTPPSWNTMISSTRNKNEITFELFILCCPINNNERLAQPHP